MALHDVEIVGRSPTGEPMRTRAAVPGGWVYALAGWQTDEAGNIVAGSLAMSTTFVPDPDAPHAMTPWRAFWRWLWRGARQ